MATSTKSGQGDVHNRWFEHELRTFRGKLPQLRKKMEGQFVLIRGEETSGPFRSEDEAYKAGCEKYGLEPFLVMLVEGDEKPIPMFLNIPPNGDPQPKS